MRSLANTCAVTVAIVMLCPSAAGAEPDSRAPEPTPRVLAMSTARLLGSGSVFATTSVSNRGETTAAVALGIGGIAEIELTLDSVRACRTCDNEFNVAAPKRLGAQFRLGISEHLLWHNQPAVVLGFQRVEARLGDTLNADTETARLYLIASKLLGPTEIHLGAEVTDARQPGDADPESNPTLLSRIRPALGLGWIPTQYPRTTMLADLSWSPNIEHQLTDSMFSLRWRATIGARYQAVSWGSIELIVSHADGESIDDATVMVRLNSQSPW